MYEKIKKWYDQGLWTEAMVMDAIAKKVITSDQAAEIMNGRKNR